MKSCTGKAAYCDDVEAAAPEKAATLSIGVVAKMFKVSTLRLRLYALWGLVRRQCIDREWTYSSTDCQRIALLLKAREVGLGIGSLKQVIGAMADQAPPLVTDRGRRQCLALIRTLESRQQTIGSTLAELYRVDWKLSNRLGVENIDGSNSPPE